MKQINDTDFKQLAEAAFLPGNRVACCTAARSGRSTTT
jgi:hypothetical protein